MYNPIAATTEIRSQSGLITIAVQSRQPSSYGQFLVAYPLDNVLNIGVHGDEPFAVLVRNNRGQKIGYRVSVDGRDIQTAVEANMDPYSGTMWIHNGGAEPAHDVWQESRAGGAALVFTSGDMAVVNFTPGSAAAKGYIGVGVFTDAYIPPPPVFERSQSYGAPVSKGLGPRPTVLGEPEGPGVGAGAYKQSLTRQVSGLVQPVFNGEMAIVRFVWWDSLVERLIAAGFPPNNVQLQPPVGHPSPFFQAPGANLAGVPRVGQQPAVPATPQVPYLRTSRNRF